jgi:hypothetical protein
MARDSKADTPVATTEDAGQTAEGGQEVKLNLKDDAGRSYVGRFLGRRITKSDDLDVYLTKSGKVLVHDTKPSTFWLAETPEHDLRGHLDWEHYIEAMHALGVTPTIDLDV